MKKFSEIKKNEDYAAILIYILEQVADYGTKFPFLHSILGRQIYNQFVGEKSLGRFKQIESISGFNSSFMFTKLNKNEEDIEWFYINLKNEKGKIFLEITNNEDCIELSVEQNEDNSIVVNLEGELACEK